MTGSSVGNYRGLNPEKHQNHDIRAPLGSESEETDRTSTGTGRGCSVQTDGLNPPLVPDGGGSGAQERPGRRYGSGIGSSRCQPLISITIDQDATEQLTPKIEPKRLRATGWKSRRLGEGGGEHRPGFVQNPAPSSDGAGFCYLTFDPASVTDRFPPL